jgi:hypothetical protein
MHMGKMVFNYRQSKVVAINARPVGKDSLAMTLIALKVVTNNTSHGIRICCCYDQVIAYRR